MGQMLDYHVDEYDLRRARCAAGEEVAEGRAHRCPVEPDERAHEAAKALARFSGALDVTRPPMPARLRSALSCNGIG